IARQSQETVGELARIVRGRIERQDAVDQIDRARFLTQHLASPMELDVRLFELLHCRANGGLDGPSALDRATRIFVRLGKLALELYDASRINNLRRRGRLRQSNLQLRQALLVCGVNALRDVLERSNGVQARVALQKTNERQLEER